MAVVARPLRRLGHLDFVLLSIYWVAIGYLWTSLGGLIIPDLVLQLVGTANEGVALAALEGVGSLMAVVWQPMIGAVSDRDDDAHARRLNTGFCDRRGHRISAPCDRGGRDPRGAAR